MAEPELDPSQFGSQVCSPPPPPRACSALCQGRAPSDFHCVCPFGPCCHCHCFSSPPSHLFSDVTFSRTPSPVAPSKTACMCTHTRTHPSTHHHSLFPLPFFISLLGPYYHLHLTYLFVCMSLESRDLVLFIAVTSRSRIVPRP